MTKEEILLANKEFLFPAVFHYYQEPLVITQRGRAAAVMVSMEVYERSERDRDLLRVLARGDREVAAGKGHDLDDVMAEADRLLAK